MVKFGSCQGWKEPQSSYIQPILFLGKETGRTGGMVTPAGFAIIALHYLTSFYCHSGILYGIQYTLFKLTPIFTNSFS